MRQAIIQFQHLKGRSRRFAHQHATSFLRCGNVIARAATGLTRLLCALVRTVLLLLVIAFHPGAISASNLQNGVDAYTSGNYPEAVIQFRPLAETGDPQAQFNMGVLAFKGHGLPQDLVESYAWLTASGRQGFAFACRYRERVGAQLSPGQLQLARKRARQRLEQAGMVVASDAHPSDEDWCPERSVN